MSLQSPPLHGICLSVISFSVGLLLSGTFSVAMISPIGAPLEDEAAQGRAYRESLWEAGVLGQTLYIAAEAEGPNFHGTGQAHACHQPSSVVDACLWKTDLISWL